jgi:hypothetical protein
MFKYWKQSFQAISSDNWDLCEVEMLLLQFVLINTLSPYAVRHQYVANISPRYDCCSLASLVEAFIGVVVNKEDN